MEFIRSLGTRNRLKKLLLKRNFMKNILIVMKTLLDVISEWANHQIHTNTKIIQHGIRIKFQQLKNIEHKATMCFLCLKWIKYGTKIQPVKFLYAQTIKKFTMRLVQDITTELERLFYSSRNKYGIDRYHR